MGETSTRDRTSVHDTAASVPSSLTPPSPSRHKDDSSDGDVTVVQSAETYRCHLPSRSHDARAVRGLSYEDDEENCYAHRAGRRRGTGRRHARHRRHPRAYHPYDAHRRTAGAATWTHTDDGVFSSFSYRHLGGVVEACWNWYDRMLSCLTPLESADPPHRAPPAWSLCASPDAAAGRCYRSGVYAVYDGLREGWLRWPNRLALLCLLWTLIIVCGTRTEEEWMHRSLSEERETVHKDASSVWDGRFADVLHSATYHAQRRLDFPQEERNGALFSHPHGEGLVSFVWRAFPLPYTLPHVLRSLALLLFALQLGAITHSFTGLCGVGCAILAMAILAFQMHLMWIGCGESSAQAMVEVSSDAAASTPACEEGAVALYLVSTVLRRVGLVLAAWCVSRVLLHAPVWRVVSGMAACLVVLTIVAQATSSAAPSEWGAAGEQADSSWWGAPSARVWRWWVWLASPAVDRLTQWVEVAVWMLVLRCTLYLQPHDLCVGHRYRRHRYAGSEGETGSSSSDGRSGSEDYDEGGDGRRRCYGDERSRVYGAQRCAAAARRAENVVLAAQHAKEHVE